MIKVEVVYAESTEEQWLVTVDVLPNATIEDAIIASGLLQQYRQLTLQKVRVGIFGKTAKLTTRLNPGDRIEVYRPLKIDPKEARRKRAKAGSMHETT
ncbi:MAG: RnfH family protein [Gammaproteobacteria bacterium]|nr:RnfH family protein [Gammaproteobacteria bacterium]